MINKIKVRLINGKYYSYLQQQISTNPLSVELIADESGELITDEEGITLAQEGIGYQYKALFRSVNPIIPPTPAPAGAAWDDNMLEYEGQS